MTKRETRRSACPCSSGPGESFPERFTGPVASRSTQAHPIPTRSKTWNRLTWSSSAFTRSGSPGTSLRSPLALSAPCPTGTVSSPMVTSCPASEARTLKSPGRSAPRLTPLPRSSPVTRTSGTRPESVAWAQRCPELSPRGTTRDTIRIGRKSCASSASDGRQRSSTRPAKDSCASSTDSSPRLTSSSRPPGASAPSTARPATVRGARPLARSTRPCEVWRTNSASRRRVRQLSSTPATSTFRPAGSATRTSAPRTSSVSTSRCSRVRSGQVSDFAGVGWGRERSSQMRGRISRTRSSSSRPESGCTPAMVTSSSSALNVGRSVFGAVAESP